MDLQRLFLFLIFSFSLVLVWDGWQRYQHPERFVQQAASAKIESSTQQNVPSGFNETANASADVSKASSYGQKAKSIAGKKIHVKTDLIEAEISSVGGDINYLSLLKHPDGLDRTRPVTLFEHGEDTHNYVAQSGLLGANLPNHNSLFEADQTSYELSEVSDKLEVRLRAQGDYPVAVTKIITFQKGSYLINVAYELENTSQDPVSTSSYFQLVRDGEAPQGSSVFLPTYTGGAVYTEAEKFQKVDFSAMEKGEVDYPKRASDGWIGILQHYFVAAWLPEQTTEREYFSRKLDEHTYAVGVVQQERVILPGKKEYIGTTLYAGPAKTSLDKIAPGLGLTVDYGWLTIIATPLFWVMTQINDWTHNWGVAIIILTVLIKLAFFPLSAASYRSMAKMRLVAPKLERIKQQHGDDREQLNRAMMELYKTEKINPLGGCLPVLIQIPVFIALYWSILASVEMRYAPFFGWITDLSSADPYYILPVIMGGSMIIQMRLNPTPPDPIQAKVMQIMPIAFSVIFLFFPAGLVLYSIVNNLLSIAQQWYITKSAETESKGAALKR